MAESAASLPYHEPGIVTILVQTSLLLLLNVVNAALDRVLYCVAWGSPGAKWLSVSEQETVVQLGYLGLILLVFPLSAHPAAGLDSVLQRTQTVVTIHTLDTEVPHPSIQANGSLSAPIDEKRDDGTAGGREGPLSGQHTTHGDNSITLIAPGAQPFRAASTKNDNNETCGSAIYERYYHPAVSKIMQPFFFASIGFSIPITRMFRGAIIWRGAVYTILMAFGKFVCGLWLVRFSIISGKGRPGRWLSRVKLGPVPHLWGKSGTAITPNQASTPSLNAATNATNREPQSSPNPPKPFSLHPPLILAVAMCARGEIGFLISGVAESKGIFSPSGVTSDGPSDIFLVVTWAIVLCTIVGPLGVGLSVRRVKTLQERKNKQQEGAGKDVLGV